MKSHQILWSCCKNGSWLHFESYRKEMTLKHWYFFCVHEMACLAVAERNDQCCWWGSCFAVHLITVKALLTPFAAPTTGFCLIISIETIAWEKCFFFFSSFFFKVSFSTLAFRPLECLFGLKKSFLKFLYPL